MQPLNILLQRHYVEQQVRYLQNKCIPMCVTAKKDDKIELLCYTKLGNINIYVRIIQKFYIYI